MQYVSAIDVGGHNIRCLLGSVEGEIISKKQCRTDRNADRAQANVNRITNLIDTAICEAGGETRELQSISISVPGPVNPATGVLISAPNIPFWEDWPIRDLIQERFPVPLRTSIMMSIWLLQRTLISGEIYAIQGWEILQVLARA
jgi:glucokinase